MRPALTCLASPAPHVDADAQIKCVAEETEVSKECIGCRNLQIECTYNYVKKKPGRKNA